MNDEFIKLLELEYEELKLGLSKASIEGKGTPQEISDRREELFHSLFEKYFPFPYSKHIETVTVLTQRNQGM